MSEMPKLKAFVNFEKVFCKECQCLKQKSVVYLKVNTVGRPRYVYYDEDGDKHIHDESHVFQLYTCSKGHHWEKTSYGKCINERCVWNGEDLSTKE